MVHIVITDDYIKIGAKQVDLEGEINLSSGKYETGEARGYQLRERNIAVVKASGLDGRFAVTEEGDFYVLNDVDKEVEAGRIEKSTVDIPRVPEFFGYVNIALQTSNKSAIDQLVNDVAAIATESVYVTGHSVAFSKRGKRKRIGVTIGYTKDDNLSFFG